MLPVDIAAESRRWKEADIVGMFLSDDQYSQMREITSPLESSGFSWKMAISR